MFIDPAPLMFPAPSGAESKSNRKNMALRWSADLLIMFGYKHRAPLEHFLRRTTPKNHFLCRAERFASRVDWRANEFRL